MYFLNREREGAVGGTGADAGAQGSDQSTNEKLDKVTSLLTKVIQMEEDRCTKEMLKSVWDEGNVWKFTPPDQWRWMSSLPKLN